MDRRGRRDRARSGAEQTGELHRTRRLTNAKTISATTNDVPESGAPFTPQSQPLPPPSIGIGVVPASTAASAPASATIGSPRPTHAPSWHFAFVHCASVVHLFVPFRQPSSETHCK